MRIGTVIYFIPFFFVLNPALLLQGPWSEILVVVATALIGILLVSAGLQGYLIGAGRLANGALGWLGRLCLIVGGLTLAAPGGGMIGLTHLQLGSIALIVAAPGIFLAWSGGRHSR